MGKNLIVEWFTLVNPKLDVMIFDFEITWGFIPQVNSKLVNSYCKAHSALYIWNICTSLNLGLYMVGIDGYLSLSVIASARTPCKNDTGKEKGQNFSLALLVK